MEEVKRIKGVYAERDRIIKGNRYSYFNLGHLFITQGRERALIKFLKKYKPELESCLILDVGCGTAGWLRDFVKYGAEPKNLYGLDLLEDRVKEAKYLSPNIETFQGNAEKLPFPEKNFDIVIQGTVFTSIFDKDMKKNIAAEMLRVLKDDGVVIWYDFKYNNPKNPDVKGIRKREIKELFPNCSFHFRLITLVPPLARRLGNISWALCYLLERVRFLRTHYLVVIRKLGLSYE